MEEFVGDSIHASHDPDRPVDRPGRTLVAFSVMHGVLGSVVGLGVGTLVVRWVTTRVFTVTTPDMGLEVLVTSGTIVTACALAVLALGAAPLLTARRLRRMDVPGTLRITE